MEYPVTAVGNAAHVQADVRALLQADTQQIVDVQKAYPGEAFNRFFSDFPIYYVGGTQRDGVPIASVDGVLTAEISPVKVCLLLRLGETALAQSIWAAWWPACRST